MMFFVFRPRRRVKDKLRIARTFSGKFQLRGEDVERERVGLSLGKREQGMEKQAVEKSVREYIESRRGLHRDEKYVRELELKLLRLMRECSWSRLGDITAAAFEAWRARQPRSEMLPKTLNEYRAAIFGFCKWLEGRIGSNPIRSVEKIKASGDPKWERRAFTGAELARLIEVSGERGIVYLVAASTGIRRGEFAKIEWRDVHIDDARPYIAIRSSIAKNAKLAHQPLLPGVAVALRQCRPVNVAPTDLVFKRLIPRMNRFRADLAAAGIAYINEKGEYAHFHSLRKTLGTELAKAGVPIRIAMELMRHSDAKLTTKTYTDAGMLPIWDTVAGLPMFSDTQIDTLKLVKSGQSESAAVPLKDQGPILLAAGGQSVSPSESASVGESPEVADGARCRVRTCDFLRVKQALYH